VEIKQYQKEKEIVDHSESVRLLICSRWFFSE
jgi:hypothetical protein